MAASAVTAASAASVDFSYAPADAPLMGYGFGKVETYDVAIRISDPGLVGAKIIGIHVPITTDEGITGISGWLATSLKLSSNAAAPDIASVEGAIVDGVISVTFPEPYTITSEGVYAGYTFKVGAVDTEQQKNPLVVVDAVGSDGLYIHANRTYRKWTSLAESTGTVSALAVVLEGDFQPDVVSVAVDDCYGVKNGSSPVNVTLTNNGTTSVSNFSYTYTLSPSGLTGQGIAELETAIPAQLGQKGKGMISVTCPDTYEPQTLSVTITEINGNPNLSPAATASAVITPVDFIPEARPLMEEYTGLWCGWCPRGFIALEEMGRRYPERFIGVSFHNSDVMQITEDYPYDVAGFPDAVMNRELELDPYYGTTSGTDLGIAGNWQALTEVFPDADLKVTLHWTDETHTKLQAIASTRFVFDHADADYRLSYMVVSDGLTCPDPSQAVAWAQSNYYAGNTLVSGYGWEVFTQGASKVPGLVFNDIVVYAKDYLGKVGSVPSNITRGINYTDEFSVNLSDIVNIDGNSIVQDPSKLRVVAVLTDASTGKFVNCNRSDYPGESGIGSLSVGGARVTGVIYHDLSGRRLDSPAKGGVTICTEILSDGTTRTYKTMR